MSDNNPFEQPAVDVLEVGELDVAAVTQDALGLVTSNLGVIFGGSLLALGIYIASACTIIGILFSLPVLMLGMYNLFLRSADNVAEASDVMGPLDFGEMFLKGWGLILFSLLIAIPGWLVAGGVGLGVGMALEAGVPIPLFVLQLISPLVMMAWGLVTIRFCFIPLLLVERVGFVDSINHSLQLTGPVWMKLIALYVLLQLLSTPNLFATAYVGQMGAAMADPTQVESLLPIFGGVYVAILFFSVIAGIANLAIFTAAYRQLRPSGNELAY